MLDPQSAVHGTIPAVDPADLERFWLFKSQHPADPSASYSIRAILQICESESADPIAIWARAALISIVLEQTGLEAWRNDGQLLPAVFLAAAVFPLPNGLQGINPEAFVSALCT